MSVPKSLRSKSKLEVLNNADELAAYTIKVCSNENNFPKKYRWTMVDRIINKALNVSTNVAMANEFRTDDEADREMRRKYQKTACAELIALAELLRIATGVLPFAFKYYENWTILIKDVKEPLQAWIRSDKKL